MATQYCMVPLIIALMPDASVHTGDNIIISDVTVDNNSQVIGKGNGNNNFSEKSSNIDPKELNKSWIKRFNDPATIAALMGFLTAEIGTHIYQTSYNHLISVAVALFVLIIVAIFNKN